MVKRIVLVGALSLGLAPGFAFAQTAGGGCLVEEAAKAALERELALIEELAADPEDSFSGPQSCINSDIFSSLDLSMLIPDLAGMLSSFSTDAITGIIQDAQAQACRAINDAMSDAIGSATDRMSSFSSGLSSELQGILDNGWEGLDL